MWVFGMVGMLVAAFVTAAIAERKGQDGLPWFLVGLLAPVLGLLIAVLVLRPANTEPDRSPPTAAEAARDHPVARGLAVARGATVEELAQMTGRSERATVEDLDALRILGLAGRGGDGRWYLTEDGAVALDA